MMLRTRLLLAAFSLIVAYPAAASDVPPECGADGSGLQVASPDWRDQIIYFLMLDRFADGDPSNNDQGMGEYRPQDSKGYSGGDLKGVRDRLDYIQSLGATTVWTTPPVANQWWSDESDYGGYHGYWARDFGKIDEHNGTMADYQQLSCALHKRSMYLVMDIVVNHVGDFFNYDPAAMSTDPATGYRPARGKKQKLAYPFNLNDPRRPEDRAAAIYNWSRELTNYYDRDAELTQQLSRLDDINTRNPAVRSAFKEVFGRWIADAGVDAFRVDTVKYVEPDFFDDFLNAPDGIIKQAEKTGRKNFLVFGEVKENAPPFALSGEKKMAEYFGPPTNPIFPSLINFPLQEEMLRVLAQGLPPAALRYRLDAFMHTHPDPTLATNFVDNHDMPRFLSQGSVPAFKQALALTFTLPGIPMIYQGNEQAIDDTRQAMFKGGYGADHDHFDQSSQMYGFIRKLAAIRSSHPALRRGSLTVLASNANLPGVFAFRRDIAGESVFVILNTADYPTLLAGMPTGLVAGSPLRSLLDDGAAPELASGGLLTMELAPRAMLMFAVSTAAIPASKPVGGIPDISLDRMVPLAPLSTPYRLSGRYTGTERTLRLVIDGDLGAATPVVVGKNGRWQTILPAGDLGSHRHVAQIYAPISSRVSPEIPYTTHQSRADWQATLADPAHDDTGPDGNSAPPTSPGFRGQLDITQATVRTGGDVLELELQMRATSADWYPANGFDHVAFATFFDLPGQAGLSRSDALNAAMPADFTWSATHTVFGWGNSLTLKSGQKVGRAPTITVAHDRKTIKLSYRASSLGLKNWNGVRLYVTTFDREGEGAFRPTTREGGPMTFRGNPDGPRIIDDLLLQVR